MLPEIWLFALSFRMNVVAVTDPGATGSSKVAAMAAAMGMFVAPSAGVVVLTVGLVVSGAIPVVNVQT